jgi:antitoxin component YwqK of YwqJK toxin-antitoxin module
MGICSLKPTRTIHHPMIYDKNKGKYLLLKKRLSDNRYEYAGEFCEISFKGVVAGTSFSGKLRYGNRVQDLFAKFINGEWTAKGTEYNSDSLIYEGEFKFIPTNLSKLNSRDMYSFLFMRHGKGKEYVNGKCIYEGMFEKSVYNGPGVIYDVGGRKYIESEFKHNLIHGNGTIYYENGSVLAEVIFSDNNVCGHCKFYSDDGKLTYEGDVMYNLPHGEGCRYNVSFRQQGRFEYGLFADGVFEKDGIIFNVEKITINNQLVIKLTYSIDYYDILTYYRRTNRDDKIVYAKDETYILEKLPSGLYADRMFRTNNIDVDILKRLFPLLIVDHLTAELLITTDLSKENKIMVCGVDIIQ